MVTMITLHLLAQENFDQAIALLKINTELSRKAKGFISRNIYFSSKNHLKGYSVTTWETREDCDNFAASPERPPLNAEGDLVYEITDNGPVLLFTYTDSDVFEVMDVP